MNEDQIVTKFLLDTKALEILESKLKEFNPFSIMKIENYEIRHSNILSWLFNPIENHHLSDKVLKKFLLEVILNNEALKIPFSIRDIYLLSFTDVEVYREYKNIDIFIKSEKNKTIILIENKIKSKESPGQLTKYFEYVKTNYKEYKIIPILLTVHGDEPIGDEKYLMFSHESLYDIIKNIIYLEQENINTKVVDFITYYLKSMEIILMENDEIINLCKDIYRKHKDAIDIINKYATTSILNPVLDDFIKDKNDIEEFTRTNYNLWFLPKDLINILPQMNHNWQSPFPLSFWFWFGMDRNSIGLILEVGPWDNSEDRLNFMKHLDSKDIKFNKKALTIDAKYTRIFSKYNKFSDWESESDILEEMNKLYSETEKEQLKNIIEIIKKYNWSKVKNGA